MKRIGIVVLLFAIVASAAAQPETPQQRERREIIEALDDLLTVKALYRQAIASSTATLQMLRNRDELMQRAHTRLDDRITSDTRYVTLRGRAKADSMGALQEE